jgi:hypothetical protein
MKRTVLWSFILVTLLSSAVWAEGFTTIRVLGEPEALWGKQADQTMLGGAKVTVRNVGSIPAKEVRVEVEVTGGDVYPLNGPATLEPNQRATYSAKIMKYVAPNAHLKARVGCSNCR